MEQNQPSGGQSQGEEEFVLDFGKLGSLSEKLYSKYTLIFLLFIVLFISGYLRYIPHDKYPPDAPLGAADNWWMYRHTNEIYEHGYPGTAVVGQDVYKVACAPKFVCFATGGKLYWDYLHDAPEGGAAPVELYFYLTAYTYKYIGRFFFDNLMLYMNFIPVVFGVLATLSMFLLVREGFGNKSALAAAFIFGISTPFLQRSVAGQADSDAIVLFMTLFTAFVFFRAWNTKKFKWAATAGITMFFFALTWPGGYSNIPFLIIAAGAIYYVYKILELNFGETGHMLEFRSYYFILMGALALAAVLSYTKGLPLMLTMGLGGALFVVAFLIPAVSLYLQHHARIKSQLASFGQLKELISKSLRITSDFVRGKQPDVHPEWLGILVIVSFIAIGALLVALLINPALANIFSSIKNFITLRAVQRAPLAGADVIRNVFLTVAEFNPATFRTVFFSIHIAPIVLAISSIMLLPFGLLKKLRERFYFVAFILLWLVTTYYASLNGVRFIEQFSIPVAILASIVASAYDIYDRTDKVKRKTILTVGPLLFIAIILLLLPNMSAVKGQPQFGPAYIPTSFSIASQVGGGEGQNWLEFYKWARENTPEGTIFASWWDPGHGFTALAERPTVADGSQNHRHVHDLAIMFTTNNVTEAVQLMKKYNIAYFYTSTDLISKYGAISFLASGNGEGYQILTVDTSQVVESGSSVTVPYPFTIQTPQGDVPTSVVLTLKGNNYSEGSASWVIGNNQPKKIARIFYYDPQGNSHFREEASNDTIDMLLYVNPGYGNAFLLPPHIERNTLTRLHLLNGENVQENFEFVKSFNGEIKVFRVKYS